MILTVGKDFAQTNDALVLFEDIRSEDKTTQLVEIVICVHSLEASIDEYSQFVLLLFLCRVSALRDGLIKHFFVSSRHFGKISRLGELLFSTQTTRKFHGK